MLYQASGDAALARRDGAKRSHSNHRHDLARPKRASPGVLIKRRTPSAWQRPHSKKAVRFIVIPPH